jgi:signal transduction histidine kinase
MMPAMLAAQPAAQPAVQPAPQPSPQPPPQAPSQPAQILAMALLLATVASIYLVGGSFVAEWPDLLKPLRILAFNWVAQFVVACAMLSLIAKAYPLVPQRRPRRLGGLAALVMACAAVGSLLQILVYVVQLSEPEQRLPNGLHYLLFWNLTLACLLVVAHSFAERSQAASHALHDADLRRLAVSGELDRARLQVLQAQIEPHFLFNALANVRRLVRTDADASRTLLTDLLRYLEEALPALRDEHTTLGREADLLRAFLAVYQVRMGPRLQTQIDVPPHLLGCVVPPMLLLTLVENALKHGLQPLVEGGQVRVAASAHGGQLTLTVADNGKGMGSGSGGGTGLANVRARLKAMYGAGASLALAVNEPRGVVATVVLPETPGEAGP